MNWRMFWHSNIDDVLQSQERHDSPWPWPVQPFRCPVCSGRGTVHAAFYAPTSSSGTTGDTAECRTCHGKGIVWQDGER